MRRKTPHARTFAAAVRGDRPLAPSARACTLPSVRALIAVGASLLAGGAATVACKGKEDISSDRRSSVASASSSSASDIVTSASTSTSNTSASAGFSTTIASPPSASTSAVAAVSCSASAHVVPHIPPSKENHLLGGKPMPVKAQCPPGDPLCGL